MNTKNNSYHYFFIIIILLVVMQIDLLLLQTTCFSIPPITTCLTGLFLYQKQYLSLSTLLIISFPISLLHYHLSGLHFLLYILLVIANAILERTLHIKTVIPYILTALYFFMQNLFYQLYAEQTLSPLLFITELITLLILQVALSHIVYKKNRSLE